MRNEVVLTLLLSSFTLPGFNGWHPGGNQDFMHSRIDPSEGAKEEVTCIDRLE
jgi:hypothetical protein